MNAGSEAERASVLCKNIFLVPLPSAPITQLLQPTQAEDKNKFKYYCPSDMRKSRPAQQFDKVKDDEAK